MNHGTTPPPSGIEAPPREESADEQVSDDSIMRTFHLPAQHLRLTQVELFDATDGRNELVHEREWLLHPSEGSLSLSGNLFLIEDLSACTGKILIKRAPLPHARPTTSSSDLEVTRHQDGGFEVALLDRGGGASGPWAVLDYRGDRVDMARSLHAWQHDQRPQTAGHATPRFLSNTWGEHCRELCRHLYGPL